MSAMKTAVAALRERERELRKELRLVESSIVRLVGSKPKARRKKKAKAADEPAAPAKEERAGSGAAPSSPRASGSRKKKAGGKKPGIANASNDAVRQDEELEAKRRRAQELKGGTAPPA